MTQSIELAHTPPFMIGDLQICPSTHEVRRHDQREIVEPRVMQVLIALAQADGAVRTRDELVFACWDGRIVGDDAIHRVLSRLRRLTDGIARDQFRIETITKVGYRLVRPSADEAALLATAPQAQRASMANRIDRRTLVVAAGATAAIGAAGAWLVAGPGTEQLPPEAEALMTQAHAAMRDGDPDDVASAISLFRKAAQAAPGSARPWGGLALAYRDQLYFTQGAERSQIESRARSAAKRALSIDPNNVEAMIAETTNQPSFGRWSEFEADCRRVLSRHPNNWLILMIYGSFLGSVGRNSAGMSFLSRAMAIDSMSPRLRWTLAQYNWTAGRLEEADAAIDGAAELWPRHYGVWFVRNRILAHTGRTTEALAMIADHNARPTGIPEWNFELSRLAAVALATRKTSDIDVAIKAHMDAAREGVGLTEVAIIFASGIGRLDDAFVLLNAYYFNRGFPMSDRLYSDQQGMYSSRRRRNVNFLFLPTSTALRADPRFARLMEEIGLEDYWRRSGTQPDYRLV